MTLALWNKHLVFVHSNTSVKETIVTVLETMTAVAVPIDQLTILPQPPLIENETIHTRVGQKSPLSEQPHRS